MIEKVLGYLAENEGRFVEELIEYARIPSVSAQPAHAGDMRSAAAWIAARCERAGMSSEIRPTAGNPVVLARTPKWDPAKPVFIVYGHYDVQPPEPFDLWTSPPFEPRLQGRNLYARGASDNKGQHLAHVNVVEAWLKTVGTTPCNLLFLIEGEEEVGSGALYDFLPKYAKELACSAVVISDTGIPSLRHPALTYALRGIAALEIRLDGPGRDLHSGLFGGSVENPAMALCQLLAKLRNPKGKITIPGFYDEVRPLTALERREMKRLPFREDSYCRMLGAPKLFGEAGFTAEEQRTSRPTFEINGLTSGYQGHGSKTIIPAWASAKITIRLVADQTPAKILRLVKAHLRKLCPPTVRLTVTEGHGGTPYLVSPTGPYPQAALHALAAGWGHPPVLLREGGSIPIVSAFKQHLGADTLLLGLALPDDNAHSPNEKFSLDAFAAGMRTSAWLWQELAAAKPKIHHKSAGAKRRR